jgi:molecular chaperone Hsp33
VRGLLLQRLPGSTSADDSLWTRAQEALDDVAPGELLRAADAAALLTTRFGRDDVRLFESQSTRFGCSCTRDRVANALRMVGQQEVEEILDEQGEVQVTCEFCNRRYAFTPDAARALFTPSAAADEAAGQMRH